jgi:hypothetical protein
MILAGTGGGADLYPGGRELTEGVGIFPKLVPQLTNRIVGQPVDGGFQRDTECILGGGIMRFVHCGYPLIRPHRTARADNAVGAD